MKPKLLIIGSSLIVNEHIKSAIKAGFDLYSLNSTVQNSENEKKYYKKYKFIKKFENWRVALRTVKNDKNIAILLAPRIKDNFKILTKVLEGKNFIFSEKPVSVKQKQLQKLIKFNNRIFVGYNRIFYRNINYLKRITKNPSSVIVKFTENKFTDIYINSIHVISIIKYLFGNLRIINKIKKKNSITLFTINNKKTPICLIFSKKIPETFSIDILDKQKRYLLKPLEKLSIYKKLNFRYVKGNKKMLVPTEKPIKIIDEYKNDHFKPGFLEQMKSFKKFLNNKKKINNDLNFAINIIKFCDGFF